MGQGGGWRGWSTVDRWPVNGEFSLFAGGPNWSVTGLAQSAGWPVHYGSTGPVGPSWSVTQGAPRSGHVRRRPAFSRRRAKTRGGALGTAAGFAHRRPFDARVWRVRTLSNVSASFGGCNWTRAGGGRSERRRRGKRRPESVRVRSSIEAQGAAFSQKATGCLLGVPVGAPEAMLGELLQLGQRRLQRHGGGGALGWRHTMAIAS